MLTDYDASFSRVMDLQNIEVLLVGDSAGMVIQGHDSTLPVTLDAMVYHTSCVARVCRRAFLMADLPFMTYPDPHTALASAKRLLQEGGAHAVKLEASAAQAEIVTALSERGIPVCAHLGLTPQSVHKLGGYKVQGRGQEAATQMLETAQRLQNAGADLLLLECVPVALSKRITQQLTIPVVGIGAGPDTDAQVLVMQDLLGITPGRAPKFSRNFLEGVSSIAQAISAFRDAVKSGKFPGPEHGFE